MNDGCPLDRGKLDNLNLLKIRFPGCSSSVGLFHLFRSLSLFASVPSVVDSRAALEG